MVSTRSSSGALPPPPAAPTKTPRKPGSGRPPSSRKSASSSSSPAGWSHTPSTLTLLWLGVSLPLVAWDTGYVLLRPRSMPGGSLHWPLWAPYELYGRVDHMYGLKQWSAGNGFTAAQGTLNLVESALYAAYLWLWYSRAVGGGAAGGRRALVGRAGGLALVVGFSAAVMTLSKTVLYCEFSSSARFWGPTTGGVGDGDGDGLQRGRVRTIGD